VDVAALFYHEDLEAGVFDEFERCEDARRPGADDDDVVRGRHDQV
jgi:hypothetical protein